MKTTRLLAAGAVAAGAGALAAAAAYPALLRVRCLTWGATPEEATAVLPGDDLLPYPDIQSTRAVTVAAPPAAIWPWLVQMGSGPRGGAYTYDWIENLFGLDMHSVNEVLPEFQDLKLGDELPLGTKGPRMRVEVLEPERALSFRSEDGNWVWSFVLTPQPDATRLVSRNRIRMPGGNAVGRAVTLLVMEPGSLVMERKMLHGIRKRAEGLVRLAGVPADLAEPPAGFTATPAASTATPAGAAGLGARG